MMKNLLIAFVFALMLINPSISIATESPVEVQEVFVGSETMDGDALKYPKGKAEIRLQRVELAEGGIVPLHSHPIPLLGNVCLLYTSPSPRDISGSRMPSSA